MKVNLVLLGILVVLVLLVVLIINTSRSKLEPVLSNNNMNNMNNTNTMNNMNNINIGKVGTYQDLIREYDSIPKTPGGIPKLIIKTSWQKLNNLSYQVKDVLNITLRLNPDYRVYYFDDDDVNNLMKSYGVKEYSAYNKIVPGAYRADLFRYCILYKYGGCYSDIGHVMLKSFDSIIEDNELVIVKDKPYLRCTGIHNALICVTPSNEFIKQVIDKSVENIENKYYGENPLDITGPLMMGKVYQCYYYNYCGKELNEKYLIKKEGIKILELVLRSDESEERINIAYITDNGILVLKTKFNNYRDVMYDNVGKLHYTELWYNEQVYVN